MSHSRCEKIKARLAKILKQRYQIDLLEKPADFCDQKLLGEGSKIGPADLIYLFFDIEREFQIEIPEKVVVDGRFNTLNNIIEIILEVEEKKVS